MDAVGYFLASTKEDSDEFGEEIKSFCKDNGYTLLSYRFEASVGAQFQNTLLTIGNEPIAMVCRQLDDIFVASGTDQKAIYRNFYNPKKKSNAKILLTAKEKFDSRTAEGQELLRALSTST